MVRKDIYVKMLQDIAMRLDLAANAMLEIVSDFNDSLARYRLGDAIDILEDTFFNCRYHTLFTAIKDIYDADPNRLDEVVPAIGTVYIMTVTDDLRKIHLKRFVYNKPNLVVVPTRSFFEENGRAIDFMDNPVFVAIEEIYNNASAAQIPAIWNYIDIETPDDIIIVSGDVNPSDDELWRKYAYSCFCHVENSKFEIPSGLQYTVNSFYSPSVIFWRSNVSYEQFFDVYNVLNEVKHSGDFLTIYLKVYQTLEYFAYRLKLVEITKGTPHTRQSFVRRLMSVTDNFRKAEDKEFCTGFKKLFPAPISADIHALLTDPAISAFIAKYYKVNYLGQNDVDSYAKVVYQLRNSIVHNKESELHFSYGNLDEYAVVIPLMKKLIDILGYGIIHIINQPVNQDLVFDRRELNLY